METSIFRPSTEREATDLSKVRGLFIRGGGFSHVDLVIRAQPMRMRKKYVRLIQKKVTAFLGPLLRTCQTKIS